MNKSLITFFTVLLCLSASVVWSKTIDDLVKRNGIYFKKFSEVPFTGEVTGKVQGSFKNGKQEGSWIGYYDNGQLNYKGNYKNGNQDGYWVWYYNDGTLTKGWSGTFKNGKKISD